MHFTVHLSILVQVKFTGYKDRPAEERKRKFVEDLHDGHSVIVSGNFISNMQQDHAPLTFSSHTL